LPWDVLSQKKLAWGILAEPVDVDVTASRLASRARSLAKWLAGSDAAVRARQSARRRIGARRQLRIGRAHDLGRPLAPGKKKKSGRPRKLRGCGQTVTTARATRAVGVMDSRARVSLCRPLAGEGAGRGVARRGCKAFNALCAMLRSTNRLTVLLP